MGLICLDLPNALGWIPSQLGSTGNPLKPPTTAFSPLKTARRGADAHRLVESDLWEERDLCSNPALPLTSRGLENFVIGKISELNEMVFQVPSALKDDVCPKSLPV